MLEPVGSTPADTSKFLASETALWSQVVKATGAGLRFWADRAERGCRLD
jgi:hypothetical protein